MVDGLRSYAGLPVLRPMIERIKHSTDGGGTKKGNGKWGEGDTEQRGREGLGGEWKKKKILGNHDRIKKLK